MKKNSLKKAAVSELQTDFRIATFGHETWPLAKVAEVEHILPFHPKAQNSVYFRSTGQVTKIEQFCTLIRLIS